VFADTWHLFLKYTKISMRMPLWSLFTLIQPLLWLLIFTQLFKNFVQPAAASDGSYMDFFVPGILIMTALFGSSWSGVSLLREITAGTVDKMLVSPVSRTAIVLSRVMHSAVQVVLQTFIIILIAWMIGAKLNLGPLNLLLAMLSIFLLGVGLAALSNGFAIVLQREEPLVMIGNLMTLPLMFLSTAMVPKPFMPGWIETVSLINPITYAVESVRAVLIGAQDLHAYGFGALIMVVFAGVSLAWAVSAFNGLRD
jgi:ABC-2 type transport system permease protein